MIGIFDSGVGGLSVFREIRKTLPDEKYIYYSDNAHCPYGEKTREYIVQRARAITEFLIAKGANIIVVACNTATAAAISALREEYSHIRFIGMEPAIKPAAASTTSGVVGVLATAGTLKADKYLNTREKYSEGVQIAEHVGKGFVELVESGHLTGEAAEGVIRESLKPLLDEGADRIVLGCTHYPFLSETILKVASQICPDRDVQVIDPAPAVAKHLLKVMQEENLIKKEGFEISLFSSGDASILNETFKRI